MKTQLKKSLIAAQQGLAAIEFAFLLPLLVALFFGTVELTRYVVITQKAENASFSLDSVISQSNLADLQYTNQFQDNIFPRIENIMGGYYNKNDVSVVISQVIKGDAANSPIKITWQQVSTNGTLSVPGETTSIVSGLDVSAITPAAVEGKPAVFDAATNEKLKTMMPNESMIVTETFYQYKPIIGNIGATFGVPSLGNKVMVSRSYSRPRVVDSFPPPVGKCVSVITHNCEGVNRVGRDSCDVAMGKDIHIGAVIWNDPTCGYIAPPVCKSVITTSCVGANMVQHDTCAADKVISYNDISCPGYVPPCVSKLTKDCVKLNTVQHNTCGPDVILVANDPKCGYVCKPTDTITCSGVNRISTNSCTGVVTTIKANDPTCGFCKSEKTTECVGFNTVQHDTCAADKILKANDPDCGYTCNSVQTPYCEGTTKMEKDSCTGQTKIVKKKSKGCGWKAADAIESSDNL